MQNLPSETRLRMADLANGKDRIGIVGLSENSIRNLLKEGKFPKPHEYSGVRGKFFIYKEIKEWLDQQTENSRQGGAI